MKSWIEVSGRRLADNYRLAAAIVKQEADAALLAVIKANGYGHGAAICAPVLVAAGAEWLGVTDAAEGALVRAALAGGHQPKILIMCGLLREDVPAIVQHGLTPMIWAPEHMSALAGHPGSEPLGVHIEIDSGMSRQGVAAGEKLRELLDLLAADPRLRVEGVMTHFASAEVAGSEQTALQRKSFEAALAMIAERGLRLAWVHAGNTSAIDNGADGGTLAWLRGLAATVGARPMVREGLGLYGYCLPLEGLPDFEVANASRLGLHPDCGTATVMTWKARIIGISEVEAGARIGYSGTFVAKRAMRLALLPVGYADGLRRELSSTTERPGGWVVISGQRAPIVGRVSMNLTTVDVTGVDGAEVGAEAVLLGEGVTAEDQARLAGTIAYEILCGVRAPAMLV